MTSFFEKRRQSGRQSDRLPLHNNRKKGDLDGDGDVDWVDKAIAAIQFLQSPKGQMLILVGAAVFSLLINLSTYVKSVDAAFIYLDVQWLSSLSWLAAVVLWGLIQVLETLPRTGWWDLDLKITIMRKLQGLDIPIIKDFANKQSDLVYWQETVMEDYATKRKIMIVFSIGAHLVDLWSLWIDFPLWANGRLTLHPNLWIVLFLMFSFEALVALSQFVKQFTSKPVRA